MVVAGDRPTVEAPPNQNRRVILVTESPLAWALFDRALGAHAGVFATARMPAIVKALRSCAGGVPVVLDCRQSVDVTLMSQIVPELPRNSRVVLWGPHDRVAAMLSRTSGVFDAWTHFAGSTPAEEVAATVIDHLSEAVPAPEG